MIRSQTNLILVRVVVRDTEGNPVTGLRKADFQMFDNKKPQTIAYFLAEEPEVVIPAEARPPESTEKNLPGAAPPSSAAPAPRAGSTHPQRFTAIFFDDYHLESSNLQQARDAAESYLLTSLDRGERVAIYTASGRVHLDFTNDRDKLKHALSRLQFDLSLQPSGECPTMNDYQAQLIADSFRGVPTRAGNPEDPMDEGALAVAQAVSVAEHCPAWNRNIGIQASARAVVTEDNQRAKITLVALDDLVRRMAETPGGERTIAMVSQGFLNKEFQPQMDALIDRALRAKVIINALDAVGLSTPEGTEVDAALSTTPSLKTTYEDLQMHSVDMDGDVMAQAAEGTGGIFTKNTNDFEAGLRKMLVPYTTYVLGFFPVSLKFDGQFHTLKVKLANSEHLLVQARRGYFAPKQAEDAATAGNEELERAIFSGDNVKGLPAQFGAQFTKTVGPHVKVKEFERMPVGCGF